MEEVRTLDPLSMSNDEYAPFTEAVDRGFNEGPNPSPRQVELSLALARTDKNRITGIWDATAGMPDQPVATFVSWDGTMNVGAGRLLPAGFISAVTVRPTHKRRGYLRRLMTSDLEAAVKRGVPLATLTASDTQIYGRFGFGRASLDVSAELKLGPKFGLKVFPSGRCEQVQPQDVLADRNRLFSAFHQRQRGSLSRTARYDVLDWDFHKAAEDTTLEALAHYGESGEIDAVAYFRMVDEGQTLKLVDLQAADPNAELGIWKTLGANELLEKVTIGAFNPTSALPWALRDPRVLEQKPGQDHIWTRILDLPKAISARGFDHDGTTIIEVKDSLGYAAGIFEIEVVNQRAHVRPTDNAPDAVLDISDLAGIYSGLSDALLLARIGIVSGPRPERLARLFAVADAPWASVYF